jgi:hypothetical protein
MDLTKEEKRGIASLKTIEGYSILLKKVVELNRDTALAKLKLVNGTDAKADAAYLFCAWDEVLRIMEKLPGQMIEELKNEGDPIYG